jgi:hypothetical protein
MTAFVTIIIRRRPRSDRPCRPGHQLRLPGVRTTGRSLALVFRVPTSRRATCDPAVGKSNGAPISASSSGLISAGTNAVTSFNPTPVSVACRYPARVATTDVGATDLP